MNENPYRGPEPPESIGKQATKRSSKVLTVLLVLAVVGIGVCLLLPVVRTARPAAYRNACMNNLKQIANALKAYEVQHHALPPAYTVDADGKPLHSWRTLSLPYLEQVELYKSIDLTKPWDDPVNAKARETAVQAFQCPTTGDASGNKTTYLAVVSPGSAILADKRRSSAEITDGASQTLLVIEVDAEHAVPWMSPVDANEDLVLGIGPDSKLTHPGGMQAVFVDGHAAFLPDDLPADQRRALISSAAGDKVLAAE